MKFTPNLSILLILATSTLALTGCFVEGEDNVPEIPKRCSLDQRSVEHFVNGMWQVQQSCGIHEHCVDEKCVDTTECQPGSRVCLNEHLFKVCTAQKTWEESRCPSDRPLCQNGSCIADAPAPCTPGTQACVDDKSFKVCSADKQWHSKTCPKDKPYCRSGHCIDDPTKEPCKAGARASCVDGTHYKSCAADGFFEVKACPSDRPSCQLNACYPSDCQGMSSGCDHKASWICQDNKRVYSSCPKDKPICQNGVCAVDPNPIKPDCTEGSKTCLDGQTARHCVDGRWQNINCANSCQDGLCQGANNDSCTSGEFRCANARTLQNCVAGKWVSTFCSDETPYCSGKTCVAQPYNAPCDRSTHVTVCLQQDSSSAGLLITCESRGIAREYCLGNDKRCFSDINYKGAVCANQIKRCTTPNTIISQDDYRGLCTMCLELGDGSYGEVPNIPAHLCKDALKP